MTSGFEPARGDCGGTSVEKLAFGVALIALGVLLVLEQQGLARVGGLHRLWPVLLLAMGAGRLASPRRRRGGVLLLGLGLIFLAENYGLARWRQLWPLFLVLGGVHLLMRGLDGGARPRRAAGDGRGEWGR